MTRIDDPDFVATEYGDESRLAARRRVWNEFLDGPNGTTSSSKPCSRPVRIACWRSERGGESSRLAFVTEQVPGWSRPISRPGWQDWRATAT